MTGSIVALSLSHSIEFSLVFFEHSFKKIMSDEHREKFFHPSFIQILSTLAIAYD
jgi:hypothetical protein